MFEIMRVNRIYKSTIGLSEIGLSNTDCYQSSVKKHNHSDNDLNKNAQWYSVIIFQRLFNLTYFRQRASNKNIFRQFHINCIPCCYIVTEIQGLNGRLCKTV